MQEIVYNDGGDIRRLKGMITGEDSTFVIVEIENRIFKINKAYIFKIEEAK
jgi:hypothetical protein